MVWFGLTALGVSTIVMATSVVQQRAILQSSADSVALAFAQRGGADAARLATAMGVSIVSTDVRENVVTVTIRNQYGSSRASATR